MPRVVSIYLPDLAIDRIRRADGAGMLSAERPLVVVAKSGSKRWIAAADDTARSAGLHIGMPAAQGAGHRSGPANGRRRSDRRRCGPRTPHAVGADAVHADRRNRCAGRHRHGHRRRRSSPGRRGADAIWHRQSLPCQGADRAGCRLPTAGVRPMRSHGSASAIL
jgi:hypothetical protein